MKSLPAVMMLGLTLTATAVWADPPVAFPGQAELSAGLACWRNLELDCAQAQLERALELFDAGKDPLYTQHVSEARLTLGLLHIARDDLATAEHEFYLLLLVVPDFELPRGDYPPKVGYVLEQARKLLQSHQRSPRQQVATASLPSRPAEAIGRPAAQYNWQAGAGSEFIFVFGSDATAVYPGLGAELWLARTLAPAWRLGLRFAWARHPARQARAALQYFGTGLVLGWQLYERPLALELVAQALAQAMGTKDRYDRWAARLALGAGLAWPTGSSWSLRLQLLPALLATGSRVSFSLVAGAGLDWHW